MLRMIHELKGYRLAAQDDEFGKVVDFLFDEGFWTVRYLVADTGRWLPGRKVLISPMSLRKPDWQSHLLAVDMTREAIEKAPSLASDAPVSRRYEQQWLDTFGYPYYWGAIYAWGVGATPWNLAMDQARAAAENREDPEDADRVLRSVEEVRGYRVNAADGDEAGFVEDFILDDETWALRYLVVDTHKWWPGRKVLLPPEWAVSIDWMTGQLETDVALDQIRQGPEFDPKLPINREFEERMYDFFGRPAYWL